MVDGPWALPRKLAVAPVGHCSLAPKVWLVGSSQKGGGGGEGVTVPGELSVSHASFVWMWSVHHPVHDRHPGNDWGMNGQVTGELDSGLSCTNPRRNTAAAKWGVWMNRFKWHAEKAAMGGHPWQPGYHTCSPPLSSCFFGAQPQCMKSQTRGQNMWLVWAEEVGRVHLLNKYVCVFESHQLLQTVLMVTSVPRPLASGLSPLSKELWLVGWAEGTPSGLQEPGVALNSHLSAACPAQHPPVRPCLYTQAAHRLFVCLSLTQLEKQIKGKLHKHLPHQ